MVKTSAIFEQELWSSCKGLFIYLFKFYLSKPHPNSTQLKALRQNFKQLLDNLES